MKKSIGPICAAVVVAVIMLSACNSKNTGTTNKPSQSESGTTTLSDESQGAPAETQGSTTAPDTTDVPTIETKVTETIAATTPDESKVDSEGRLLVKVYNAKMLVENIKSNTHIFLMPGSEYFLPSIRNKFGEIDNIVLEGMGDEPLLIRTGSNLSGKTLLGFIRCSKVRLINLQLKNESKPNQNYYNPPKVLSLESCSDVSILNCIISGGWEGLYTDKTKNLICENTIIRDSSGKLSMMYTAEDFSFVNCTLKQAYL